MRARSVAVLTAACPARRARPVEPHGAAVRPRVTRDGEAGERRDRQPRRDAVEIVEKHVRHRAVLGRRRDIRFFRLAEKRIGERAEYGIVSFISNSSYLTGRSHPLMRESLLRNFHEIRIDNTHGNRLASERTPWGDSCETLFSLPGTAGIKLGTCISTFIKTKARPTPPEDTPVFYRDFWGRADAKRRALVVSRLRSVE